MASLTYTLDGNAGPSFEDFVHSKHFTQAFENALLDKGDDELDVTGNSGSVDFQVIDHDFEVYSKGGHDGAYVSNYAGADGIDHGLDDAGLILYNTDLDGVTLELDGKIAHSIGLTHGDDDITVHGKQAQLIDGADGNDYIETGKGNDKIFGGDGNDEVHAGQGNDTVDGGAGDDRLFGDRGNDSLVGGAGDNTIDGGCGFDVAQVLGSKASYHYVGNEWSGNGNHITNTEFVKVSDGVLITVGSPDEGALARLFQAINNADPTLTDYKNALSALQNNHSLEDIAKNLIDPVNGHDDLSGGTNSQFVNHLLDNMFDGTAGRPDAGWVNDYVSHLDSSWSRAKIAADLVSQVDTADDHLGIHIDTTSH
ncbi:MAG: hypothetical protein U1E62_26400 [Alsobacter sp.]